MFSGQSVHSGRCLFVFPCARPLPYRALSGNMLCTWSAYAQGQRPKEPVLQVMLAAQERSSTLIFCKVQDIFLDIAWLQSDMVRVPVFLCFHPFTVLEKPMLLLEEPYISRELAEFAASRGEAVLDTPSAREAAAKYQVSLTLLADEEFAARCRAGERLYTNSENALDWLYTKSGNDELIAQVEKLKNKAEMRRQLAPLYPDYVFRELGMDELLALDVQDLPMPCVLKPSVGFCSLGVYTVGNAEQWEHARKDIREHIAEWCTQYPASVLGNQSWVIESLIQGTEYAVDVYFDEQGEPVICNILQHDFASAEDVSDRLYYTGADIIRSMLTPLEEWFRTANTFLKLHNFPAHVELRREDSGRIVPIEFNPLRFAGLSCTDLSIFAWGFATYGCFLDNTRPDWERILEGRDDRVYTLMVLNKPENCPEVTSFDYEAMCRLFRKVICLRDGFYDKYSHFGILFTETLRSDWAELESFARNDLTDFINCARHS